MNTHCQQCGNVLEPAKQGRPRKYCRACSPTPPSKIRAKLQATPEAGVQGSDTNLNGEPGRVRSAVEAEIERADAGGSVPAALAVTLAERLDLGTDSGTGLAALAKAIRSLIVEISVSAAREDGLVQQLREARDRKRPRQRREVRRT